MFQLRNLLVELLDLSDNEGGRSVFPTGLLQMRVYQSVGQGPSREGRWRQVGADCPGPKAQA